MPAVGCCAWVVPSMSYRAKGCCAWPIALGSSSCPRPRPEPFLGASVTPLSAAPSLFLRVSNLSTLQVRRERRISGFFRCAIPWDPARVVRPRVRVRLLDFCRVRRRIRVRAVSFRMGAHPPQPVSTGSPSTEADTCQVRSWCRVRETFSRSAVSVMARGRFPNPPYGKGLRRRHAAADAG